MGLVFRNFKFQNYSKNNTKNFHYFNYSFKYFVQLKKKFNNNNF